jgi:hypothetical protein
MNSLEDVKRDFLLEGLHDTVGLWQFGPHVRGGLGIEDDEEVKNASLKLVRELVGEGCSCRWKSGGAEEGSRPGHSALRVGAGTLLAVIVTHIAQSVGLEMPDEVALAISGLTIGVVGYFTPPLPH